MRDATLCPVCDRPLRDHTVDENAACLREYYRRLDEAAANAPTNGRTEDYRHVDQIRVHVARRTCTLERRVEVGHVLADGIPGTVLSKPHTMADCPFRLHGVVPLGSRPATIKLLHGPVELVMDDDEPRPKIGATTDGQGSAKLTSNSDEWEHLAQLAEAATEGPWFYERYGADDSAVRAQVSWVCGDPGRADGEFIAACDPPTILRLIEENARYRRTLDAIALMARGE